MNNPSVTVLMSVHNEPLQYIDVAVKSILNQTYSNIEFLIIDDCSNEETFSGLQNIAAGDSRIKLLRNETNLGLTETLNKGLAIARGEFIARMDADDYSCPERLQRQVEYLLSHPDIDILGTGVVSFGQKTCFMSPSEGADWRQVQGYLFFSSSLCHPSVMMRREFLSRTGLTYDPAVKKGQDFDMWERSSVHGRLEVLPEVLLYYRLHSRQITNTNRNDQNSTAFKVITRRLSRLGLTPDGRQWLCHQSLNGTVNAATIPEIEHWMNKLIEASTTAGYIDTETLQHDLRSRFVLAKMKRKALPSLSEMPVAFSIISSRIKMYCRLWQFRRLIEKTITEK